MADFVRYLIKAVDIKDDLTPGKGRPQWIFSCYGPGKNAPVQLFGGPEREQSFEEMRALHYAAEAAGNPQEAIQNANLLYNETEAQIQNILSNLDQAVKYVLDGENQHPNRNDIVNTPPGQKPGQGGSFGQPAPTQAPPFGAPAQPAAPTGPAFGQPSAFGQPQNPPASASPFGQTPAFGQPSALGTSPFTQPRAQPQQNPFGKPTGPAFGSPFAQVNQQPQAPNPFGAAQQQQQQPAADPFGQPAKPAPSPFGQPSPFGVPDAAKPVAPTPAAPLPTIKTGNTGLNPCPPLSGETRSDPLTKKLVLWKGQQVQYIDNEPCYQHPQDPKTYVHIYFPDGAPGKENFKHSVGKPDEYTPAVEGAYKYAKEHGTFKDDLLPGIPPKPEWCSFDI